MASYKDFNSLKAGILEEMKAVLASNLGLMLEDFLKWEISRSVEENVYNVYQPKQYERRKNKGGLSDRKNIQITSIELDGEKVRVTAENLTEGAWNEGVEISHIIEYGAFANQTMAFWYDEGVWQQPRPFMAKLMEEIKKNPSELHGVIATSFKNAGFKIKQKGREY